YILNCQQKLTRLRSGNMNHGSKRRAQDPRYPFEVHTLSPTFSTRARVMIFWGCKSWLGSCVGELSGTGSQTENFGARVREVIKDEYSDGGHFALVLKQGERLGLTRDEIVNAKPLRTSMAAFYAWGWIPREKGWIEGLAAMTITEWTNDDRLLTDLGGGNTSRTAKRMIADLGIQ
ncbi:MAG: hypothetical protein WD688_02150, partial [Candidatus Binatia bacterium]